MINLHIFVYVVNMYLLNKLSVVGFLTSEVSDFAKNYKSSWNRIKMCSVDRENLHISSLYLHRCVPTDQWGWPVAVMAFARWPCCRPRTPLCSPRPLPDIVNNTWYDLAACPQSCVGSHPGHSSVVIWQFRSHNIVPHLPVNHWYFSLPVFFRGREWEENVGFCIRQWETNKRVFLCRDEAVWWLLEIPDG